MEKDIISWLEWHHLKVMFYHEDGDGICSAALILKKFSGFKYHAREGPKIEGNFLTNLISKNPELIVFLDIPIDQDWKTIEEIKNRLLDTNILIIDHHIPEKDLTSERVIHYNPRFEKKDIYLPASYLVYNILEKQFDMKEHAWIAAIGVISDYGYRECKEFLEQVKKDNPELLDYKNIDDIFKTRLGKASEIISSAITVKGLWGANYALRKIIAAANCDEFLDNPQLLRWHKLVRAEIDRILTNFEKEKVVYNDINLIIGNVDSRFNVTSVVASILSKKYPDKIVVLRKKSNKGWKMSARNQTLDLNIGEIIKKSCENIGVGGGHERAAGAVINDWNMFEKNLIRNLKEKYCRV
jgi:single-stranded DNA-specific DHH superfamily exonuclease